MKNTLVSTNIAISLTLGDSWWWCNRCVTTLNSLVLLFSRTYLKCCQALCISWKWNWIYCRWLATTNTAFSSNTLESLSLTSLLNYVTLKMEQITLWKTIGIIIIWLRIYLPSAKSLNSISIQSSTQTTSLMLSLIIRIDNISNRNRNRKRMRKKKSGWWRFRQ